MIKTLNMQYIRYANLFNKVTRIRSNHCFEYNNAIVFAIPRNLVSKAIGPENKNLKKLSYVLGRKVKIVAIPKSIEDIENFVSVITYPIKFKAIEIKDGVAVINVANQFKAALIGRQRNRLNEMTDIIDQYFGVKKTMIR